MAGKGLAAIDWKRVAEPARSLKHHATPRVCRLLGAALSGRIVVSHDVSTMPQAFDEFRRTIHSPGVLLTLQSWAIAEVIEHLVLIRELTEASEWQDRICYLPTFAGFSVGE